MRRGGQLLVGAGGCPSILPKEAVGDGTVVEPRLQSPSMSSIVPSDLIDGMQIENKITKNFKMATADIQTKGRPPF